MITDLGEGLAFAEADSAGEARADGVRGQPLQRHPRHAA